MNINNTLPEVAPIYESTSIGFWSTDVLHFISCSNASNSGVPKNSPRVISRPSHSFLIVTAPGFLLSPFKILFTVAWGTAGKKNFHGNGQMASHSDFPCFEKFLLLWNHDLPQGIYTGLSKAKESKKLRTNWLYPGTGKTRTYHHGRRYERVQRLME